MKKLIEKEKLFEYSYQLWKTFLEKDFNANISVREEYQALYKIICYFGFEDEYADWCARKDDKKC